MPDLPIPPRAPFGILFSDGSDGSGGCWQETRVDCEAAIKHFRAIGLTPVALIVATPPKVDAHG